MQICGAHKNRRITPHAARIKRCAFPNVSNGQQQSHNGGKHACIEDLLGAHQVVELEGEPDQDAGKPQEQKGEGEFRKVHGAR